MSKYAEKLRDPRWQRMRLKVMERDGFACRECGDTRTTLNVHHTKYVRGRDPWEYTMDALETLCENCHKAEHGVGKSKAALCPFAVMAQCIVHAPALAVHADLPASCLGASPDALRAMAATLRDLPSNLLPTLSKEQVLLAAVKGDPGVEKLLEKFAMPTGFGAELIEDAFYHAYKTVWAVSNKHVGSASAAFVGPAAKALSAARAAVAQARAA